MNLKAKVVDLNIPDGKNEDEMWEIFNIVFDFLKNNDELYFDLTHSFRYLPMLILVLGNYSNFLKQTVIKHISYGNYEARTSSNLAPIVNLLPLAALQDWTFAAGQFLESGNIDKLKLLSEQKFKPILKETQGKDDNARNLREYISNLSSVVDDFNTCRGINILKSESLKKFAEIQKNITKTIIPPLNPILKKIEESLSVFDKKCNVENGFYAAKWCLNNNLYQQATTILNENIVSFICEKEKLNWETRNNREIVSRALNIISQK
jgi:CRISPR-associated protein, TM1812 family